MKKIEVGQTIAILANLGVVIGLVLLVMEIEQSNDQAAAGAYQARIDQIALSQQQFALSPILPPIYVKLEQKGLNSLDAEELLRVNAWELARSQRMAGQYYQYQRGYLDETAYRTMMRAAQNWIDLDSPRPFGRTESDIPVTVEWLMDWRPDLEIEAYDCQTRGD